jgi:hypothetical protein
MGVESWLAEHRVVRVRVRGGCRVMKPVDTINRGRWITLMPLSLRGWILTLDFNKDDFLCIVGLVYSGWAPRAIRTRGTLNSSSIHPSHQDSLLYT